jgi:psiF repeat
LSRPATRSQRELARACGDELSTCAAIGAKLLAFQPGIAVMIRYAAVAGLLTVLLPSVPSFAVTAKEKMETCKFGADEQKLAGAARKSFMAKCMSNKNDPRGAVAAPAAVEPVPPPPQH